MSTFYEQQLLILVVACVIWLVVDNRLSRASTQKEHVTQALAQSVWRLTRQYLVVYAIVMGADWLQGPYVYSLYREQYGFPERLVAVLFVTGFVSAGITAPLVGAWADQYGRKRLCLVFCATYASACACIMVPWMPVLLFGRLLGGISTSILYSAFESWLVSSSNSLGFGQSELSSILGRATLVNGFVAAGAGVFSNQLVSFTHSFASPFLASGILLSLAWFTIRGMWSENYGAQDASYSRGGGSGFFQLSRLGQAWKIVTSDPKLMVLGLTQTCFEGSMYLFVFLWVPSLQESSSSGSLPLGYIFSCFMISMMLGSLFYTSIVSFFSAPTSTTSTPSSARDEPLVLHAKLSSLVCAVSALTFAITIGHDDEHVRFWAFCAFEACVGMYYPVQGMLRGSLISNEHRATLSSLFRVPLNIFVVVSLLTGVSSARYTVLTASACMLGFSSLMTGFVVVRGLDQSSGMPH
ncbi:hypothetical protein BXZ70DRAFT_1004605 [Cristinia sonorae]|uniref:Molybdate-anion transporter n=1 Tax=Cristinia sonorae TaxID=1940300 RepID=A0A8K0XUM6_9AGAR|nr:hypothetical protein BXZ70DRAFT_1004605 [Cristinia sonorae]